MEATRHGRTLRATSRRRSPVIGLTLSLCGTGSLNCAVQSETRVLRLQGPVGRSRLHWPPMARDRGKVRCRTQKGGPSSPCRTGPIWVVSGMCLATFDYSRDNSPVLSLHHGATLVGSVDEHRLPSTFQSSGLPRTACQPYSFSKRSRLQPSQQPLVAVKTAGELQWSVAAAVASAVTRSLSCLNGHGIDRQVSTQRNV